MLTKIDIKPLTVNKAHRAVNGRVIKSKAYRQYEKDLNLLIKPIELPEKPYALLLEFGLSSALADWDNYIKPFQDCLQGIYGFNDRDVNLGVVRKVKTKRGEEHIRFALVTTDEGYF